MLTGVSVLSIATRSLHKFINYSSAFHDSKFYFDSGNLFDYVNSVVQMLY